MREAAVVAYYDALPADLASLVTRVQALAAEGIASLAPRSLREVHATIIGLGPLDPEVNLPGLLDQLRTVFAVAPLRIRFGGFADRDYGLASRSRRLYERSLTLHQGQATLIGWPVGAAQDEPVPVLDEIRRACQRFGVVHKYHDAPGATDPDAYMVVGEYDQNASATDELDQVAHRVRQVLGRDPVTVRMSVEELQVVVYRDRRLRRQETVALPLRRLGVHTEVLRLLARR
jgi:hypothetical protein